MKKILIALVGCVIAIPLMAAEIKKAAEIGETEQGAAMQYRKTMTIPGPRQKSAAVQDVKKQSKKAAEKDDWVFEAKSTFEEGELVLVPTDAVENGKAFAGYMYGKIVDKKGKKWEVNYNDPLITQTFKAEELGKRVE